MGEDEFPANDIWDKMAPKWTTPDLMVFTGHRQVSMKSERSLIRAKKLSKPANHRDQQGRKTRSKSAKGGVANSILGVTRVGGEVPHSRQQQDAHTLVGAAGLAEPT
jgi:hypothetical protein